MFNSGPYRGAEVSAPLYGPELKAQHNVNSIIKTFDSGLHKHARGRNNCSYMSGGGRSDNPSRR